MNFGTRVPLQLTYRIHRIIPISAIQEIERWLKAENSSTLTQQHGWLRSSRCDKNWTKQPLFCQDHYNITRWGRMDSKMCYFELPLNDNWSWKSTRVYHPIYMENSIPNKKLYQIKAPNVTSCHWSPQVRKSTFIQLLQLTQEFDSKGIGPETESIRTSLKKFHHLTHHLPLVKLLFIQPRAPHISLFSLLPIESWKSRAYHNINTNNNNHNVGTVCLCHYKDDSLTIFNLHPGGRKRKIWKYHSIR